MRILHSCIQRRATAICLVILLQAAGEARLCQAAPSPTPEEVEAAVRRAVVYLKKSVPTHSDGRATLAALALMKAEVPADSPEVDRVLKGIVAKVKDGKYKPANIHEHGYESGLDAITLETADREKYKTEIEAIAQYLIEQQLADGPWNYGDSKTPPGGDTSITQYGILGLWAASRAGIAVPVETWDKAALWHIKSQRPGGGFAYHPFDGHADPTIGMTAAGAASLHICRLHLFPKAGMPSITRPEVRRSKPAKRFGVLERIEPETGKSTEGSTKPAGPYVPKATLAKIDETINSGLAALTKGFTIEQATRFRFYYLYTLERLAALADVQTFGDHDWYAEGAAYLLSIQSKEGTWKADNSDLIDTSFAVMFLVRSTAKMINKPTARRTVGGGLLAGGRGLPDDLKAVQVKDGKIGTRKVQGPIDELLAELENTAAAPVESVQKAIVEAVQLGDREALIAQTDRLKKLAVDPRAEVRRTAFWALGRSRDVRIVPLLIRGLEDRDVDVVVEAHNALCFVARKPQGLGSPLNPLEELGEEATPEQKTAALLKWQPPAVRQWKSWYLTVRPFEERHDLDEPKSAK